MSDAATITTRMLVVLRESAEHARPLLDMDDPNHQTILETIVRQKLADASWWERVADAAGLLDPDCPFADEAETLWMSAEWRVWFLGIVTTFVRSGIMTSGEVS